MLYIILIALVAFLASILTFFSGFGLGTLLAPVLVIFLPVQLAISATAIVHFLNNLFKLFLMNAHINWRIFNRFAPAAFIGAIVGAFSLSYLSELEAVVHFKLFDYQLNIVPINLVIGLIFILFSFAEFTSKIKSLSIPEKFLSLGGFLTGFFGGLSGNQGAFRSALLSKTGLDKRGFIATGVMTACLVDLTRLIIYFNSFNLNELQNNNELRLIIVVATLGAFSGALLGKRFLDKVTMRAVQLTISSLMFIVGLGLITGLL